MLFGAARPSCPKDPSLTEQNQKTGARLDHVSVVRDGRAILADVKWSIDARERWVILGPNGSGKTTMLRVASGRLVPTSGVVSILGETVGKTDLRALRARVSLVSGAVTRQLATGLRANEVVVTGSDGALAPWWHEYSADEWAEAEQLLAQMGIGGTSGLSTRPFEVISEGERQRVLLARALMGHPELLFLDEPAAGLDLGAPEQLLARLGALAVDPEVVPFALVTHHTEEIPRGTTHAALLRDGAMVAAGPIESVLNSEAVSSCFSLEVEVGHRDGRWWSAAVE